MKGWGSLTWHLIVGAFIVAVTFMLVRPGSPAAKAVADVSNALAILTLNSTHYTVSKNTTAGTSPTGTVFT